MKFAVVKIWKDNPNEIQVLEYVTNIKAGINYIKKLPKSAEFEYEIMEYV